MADMILKTEFFPVINQMPLIVPSLPNIQEDDLASVVGKIMIDDINDPESMNKDPGVPMDLQFVFFRSQLPEGVMVLPIGTFGERETAPNIVVDKDGKVVRVNV